MVKANTDWLSKVCSPPRAALTILIVFGSVTPVSYACAGDSDADTAVSKDLGEIVIRQAWQEHVRAEKRRIRELASQRRLDRLQDAVEPLSDEEPLVSEQALNDITLERGDIVVTDKGAFVFKGQTQKDRTSGDFEPLGGYAFRR